MINPSQEEIKKDFIMQLCHGSEIDIMYSLIGIGMHLYDYDYVIGECRKLVDTNSTIILRGIIFALGHLARNFNTIDLSFANLVIDRGVQSRDEITIDAAKNLQDDLYGLIQNGLVNGTVI